MYHRRTVNECSTNSTLFQVSMSKSKLCCYVLVGLYTALPLWVSANPAVEIGWDDLVGQIEPYEDPFLALNFEQIADFGVVAILRERQKRDGSLSNNDLAELREKEQVLQAQEIDVDYLLGQREIIIAKRTAASEATNDSLDKQRIRMPGYLLPLEFDGGLVTEFLLVPFVGACIHVPPPPPNQIVHVTYATGHEYKGLFAPVWVEGKMRVGKMQKDLFLADGSADIPIGYSLNANLIEPYKVSQ